MSTQNFETTTNTASLYMGVFDKSDETIPMRLVGSYEYIQAVDAFENLLAISTADELYVYDKFLDERPEFTFFNGTNAAFNSQPDLSKADPFERKQYDEKFKKKGLAWMLALARIELASTISLYGHQRFPFEAINPGEFEVEQYLDILNDDVVAHLKSLEKEPGFEEVIRPARIADTWTLAYLRRIKLVKDMLNTLSDARGEETAYQVEPYMEDLKRYEKRLVRAVKRATQFNLTTGTRTRSGRLQRSQLVDLQQCEDFASESFGETVRQIENEPASPSPYDETGSGG